MLQDIHLGSASSSHLHVATFIAWNGHDSRDKGLIDVKVVGYASPAM